MINDPDAITAAHRHPLIATIDPDASYTGTYSNDCGTTWQPIAGQTTVCGGHVQVEIAYAVRRAGAAYADGPVITVVKPSERTRWTPAT
ncbi:hypothetical protein [Streptomyces sp. SR-10]|uniref:hypothetical protein n=1 Tax=Streptomyces sp. SR-10 TaxID=3416442 RepID=UPI003CFB7EB0